MTLADKMQNLVENLNVKGSQEFMGKEIPVIEGGFGEGQKVMLAKTIAEIHGYKLVGDVNVLINTHKDEFEDGIDILDLKNSMVDNHTLLELGYTKQKIANSKNIYLLSEQGYMLLAGFMEGEKAKEIRKKLRREYFSMREQIRQQPQITATDDTKQLNAQARLKNAKVREANTYLKIADRVGIEKYKQIMCTYASKALSGQELIPLPKAERKTYSATEIGEKLGISANKVGSLANKYNLKTKDYGLMVWDKSRHSNKQVETFRYYDTVIEPLKRILEGVVPLVK